MKTNIFIAIVLVLVLTKYVHAQQFRNLTQLNSNTASVYCSKGQDARAKVISLRLEKAMLFYQSLLGFTPQVNLLVLTAADWSTYTSFPVYGMPHYDDDKTLIVAAEDNPFWKSFLPPLDQLPEDLRKKVEAVYRNERGETSMSPFFDLLALHELGHAFHFQGKLNMQRKWMGELFCNILLHTYVAEKEPEFLPALTLFPQMVIAGGTSEFNYTSLADLEARYDEIGQQYPKNYGWYQCRLHAAAGSIYDSDGKQVCGRLWNLLRNNQNFETDTQLMDFLKANGAGSIAEVIRTWDMK